MSDWMNHKPLTAPWTYIGTTTASQAEADLEAFAAGFEGLSGVCGRRSPLVGQGFFASFWLCPMRAGHRGSCGGHDRRRRRWNAKGWVKRVRRQRHRPGLQ